MILYNLKAELEADLKADLKAIEQIYFRKLIKKL